MKKVGIWIDKEKAHIVTLEGEKEYFKTIVSELESFNVRGGSRSKTRWGPQQVVHDSKYLEREKHQMRDYFAKLAEAVKSADVISVFGPAEIKEKFAKEMHGRYAEIGAKIQAVKTSDSMTENQVKEMVKEHFGWERP